MRYLFFALLATCCSAGPAIAQSALGEWRVRDGTAHIRVVNCGNVLWGVVAWEQKAGRDIHNPNKALRSRSTLGMPILLHMRPTDERGHWEGEIYNADDGRTYDGSIALRSANVLHIEGCAMAIFCGGEDWTRAAQSQTRPARAPEADVCSAIGAGRAH